MSERSRHVRIRVIIFALAVGLIVLTPSFGQFLPRPPKDPRPERARLAFEGGRYEESAELLEAYLRSNPENAEGWLFLAWSKYRLGDFAVALQHFETSLALNPTSIDAIVGLGYASLQTLGPESAAEYFVDALERDETRGDALRGLVLAGRRVDAPPWVTQEAATAARRLEELEGKDVDTLISAEMLRAGKESRPRPPVPPTVPLTSSWRAGRHYIEIDAGDATWQPVFLKGINLVVALPGRFPSDPPTDRDTYLTWLGEISRLGANTVRVYSLLPPAFYKALAEHNEDPDKRALWLLQGAWTEVPPDHDFDDRDYANDLRQEIARVIDAVHGNLAIGPRPGKAWGSFDQDVSEWVLGYLLGRPWEPFAVKDFNQRHGRLVSWEGTWLKVDSVRPMEAWLARTLDYAIGYEADGYRTVRPVSVINSPSLDPLHHPTEATREEENQFRRELGLPLIPDATEAWNDDEVTLDLTRIEATSSNPAGFFASYQIYPHFPDFMSHEYLPDEEHSSYELYLRDLKAYHGEQPVVVVEFGISTSRGIAHLHAGGRHHGGHGEAEQGRLIASMLKEIHRQQYAGGIIFSFLDEWSRATWNTQPFEIPQERAPLWLNVQSPDQSFGLFRMTPATTSIVIDGEASDWSAIPRYAID